MTKLNNSTSTDISLTEIEVPEINELLNKENENILRNVITPIRVQHEQDDVSVVDEASLNDRPQLLNILQSCSKVSSNRLDVSLNLKAKNKQLSIEKLEKQRQIEEEKKKSELTWPQLMVVVENAAVDKQLLQEMQALDELELVNDCDDHNIVDDIGPSPEDIDKILSSCQLKHVFDLQLDKSCAGWPTVTNDTSNKPHLQTPATYDCHICLSFTADKFTELCSHIITHKTEFNWQRSDQQRLSCVICGYTMLASHLKQHMTMHIEHSRCSVCHQFIAVKDIEAHKQEHSKHFMCGRCNEVYKTKSAVTKHVTHHRSGHEYSCDDCPSTFAGLEKLVRHVSLAHSKIDPTYTECPYCLELTTAIKNHLYSADVCKLKCRVCLKVEKTHASFVEHLKTHQVGHIGRRRQIEPIAHVSPVNCDGCGMQISYLAKQNEHQRCHGIDRMYDKHVKYVERSGCELCDVEMPKSYLQFHMTKHDVYDRCRLCFKFVAKDSIAEHTTSHDNDHNCDLCGQRFTNENKMVDHRWHHSRVISRPCGQCPFTFSSELQRAQHISLVHKKIDPEFVECYFCFELIRDKVEYHLFDANYCLRRCKLCNQRFKTADQFMAHVKHDHTDLIS